MTPERWQQIREVLEAVLERPAGEKADFLNQACASDPELRAEVDSLIAYQDEAEEFLEGQPVSGMESRKYQSSGPPARSLVDRLLSRLQRDALASRARRSFWLRSTTLTSPQSMDSRSRRGCTTSFWSWCRGRLWRKN
jgi:hypothetical protein